MPTPIRDWLLFVVGTLWHRGGLPYLYSGHNADHRQIRDRMMTVARRLLELKKAHPRRAKVELLEEIAGEIGKSYSTVEKLTKRPSFKDALAVAKMERKRKGAAKPPPP